MQFDTHRQTKLTAHETINRAHQNLNVSRDLATHLSKIVCHPWASTGYRPPTYQI